MEYADLQGLLRPCASLCANQQSFVEVADWSARLTTEVETISEKVVGIAVTTALLGSISHGVLRRPGRPEIVIKAAKTAAETTA